MSQSTSAGTRSCLPPNIDQRYIRPTFKYPDSNDSIASINCDLSDEKPPDIQADETNNGKICNRCQKICKGKIGLRIHYSRMHKEFLSDLDMETSLIPEDIQSFVSMLSRAKRNIRVLKRVPKGARIAAAQKLSQLMDSCISNTTSAWMNLLLFSYTCLQVPEKSTNLTQAVKDNIKQFEVPRNVKNKVKSRVKDTPLSTRVESKLSDGDVRGAVKILSSADSLANESEEVFAELKSKHPCPGRKLVFPDPPVPSADNLSVEESQVLEAVYSFPNGTSGGVDGLRPQHLKDLLSKSNGDANLKLLSSLTNLCNMMLSGNVNSEITQIIYGATVCALNKNSGGIRPIAIGCTLRRLVSKLACRSVRESISSYLNPIQLGFGTKGGCESAIHVTRTFINHNNSSKKVILKLDFFNAFNTIERDILLAEVKEKCPKLYSFLWQCYSSPSMLFFGEKLIPSEVGLQQGDPAGPLGFSLSIHPLIQQLRSEMNIWYLDDGTLGGDPASVLTDLKTILEKCNHLGLRLNPLKCELFFCGTKDQDVMKAFEEVLPGIQLVSSLTLLGAPITVDNIDYVFEKKFNEVRTLLRRLVDMKFHIAYYLMKNCFLVPKLNYLMRTSPTWKIKQQIDSMDQDIKKTVEAIINTKLSEEKWRLSTLPVNLGGIGIRKLGETMLPAFLSSVNSTFPLVSTMLSLITDIGEVAGYAEAMDMWIDSFGINVPDCTIFQHDWDTLMCTKILESITFDSEKDKALHLATSLQESNAWLQVLPSRSIGTLLDNNQFRISMGLRLGAPICAPHTCICGEKVDGRGTHGLNCSKSAGRFSRHFTLNDVIRRGLASAKIPAVLEPVGMIREDGRRPDGMSTVPWKSGRCLVWDATCTDTLAPSNIEISKRIAGSVAEIAATKKRSKYKQIANDHHFIPVAIETMGPICKDGKKFLEELGERIASVTGEKRAKEYLMQRISLAVQVGNAASVLGTMKRTADMREVFYL